jgi:ribosomal small subunit protein bTHX
LGRGDKRSKKGKIWRGTFGKKRPRAKGKAAPKKA